MKTIASDSDALIHHDNTNAFAVSLFPGSDQVNAATTWIVFGRFRENYSRVCGRWKRTDWPVVSDPAGLQGCCEVSFQVFRGAVWWPWNESLPVAGGSDNSGRTAATADGTTMAKGKKKLEIIHLVCAETGDQNYTLRRKSGGEKLKLKKYSPRLRKHTLHNEKKK